jgi:SAM-dependent methyltransferase
MSSPLPGEYVLGTDPVELERLGLQHRLWADVTHALWTQAGVRVGHRVLDIGCGPGFASTDLAQLVGPRGRVLGIDESGPFIAELNHRANALGLTNLTGRVADVQNPDAALEGEPDFDAAFARWVLCFVRDPARVVAAAARRLRPGGRFIAFDYFNYATMALAPREPLVDEVVARLEQAIRERGGDPDIMGRMPGLAIEAGLTVRSLEAVPRIARPGEPMWDWPSSFWPSILPRMVQNGQITEDQRRGFDAIWQQASKDPARFMALPPVYLMIADKPG